MLCPPHAVGPRSYATGAMQDPGCGLRRIHLFFPRTPVNRAASARPDPPGTRALTSRIARMVSFAHKRDRGQLQGTSIHSIPRLASRFLGSYKVALPPANVEYGRAAGQ